MIFCGIHKYSKKTEIFHKLLHILFEEGLNPAWCNAEFLFEHSGKMLGIFKAQGI